MAVELKTAQRLYEGLVPDCDLCRRKTVESGKDNLLYEDGICYVTDNGNTHLEVGGKLIYADRRISLTVNEHRVQLSKDEIDLIESKLHDVLKEEGYERGDYFFMITMGTYPEHFHMHAYVPPFSEEGEII